MIDIFEVAALNGLMQFYPVFPANKTATVLIQQDLYFGRNIGTTGQVTEQQFQQFLEEVVTPRFPDSVTEYDAKGQFLDSSGTLIREPSKVISLVYEDQSNNQQAIDEIINVYKQRFQQESILQVKNQDVAIGFGQGEDLIVNDPTPELIQVDLYFDRDAGIKERGGDRQLNQFLKKELTPRFPNGLTVYDAEEQSQDYSNDPSREPSKVVSLIIEDTEANEQLLYQVIDAYEEQFQQKSVLEVVNEEVKVGFGQGEDLIDNSPVPELIQIDLYFGCNIGTTRRVSNRQFNQFLRDEITPRFPDGLTVYDAKGQFLDSTNRLIREPSKVVSLILEDTQINEDSISQIIDAYKQKFQQESVLAVVDETLNVAFDVSGSTSTESARSNLYSSIFEHNQAFLLTVPAVSSLVSPFQGF